MNIKITINTENAVFKDNIIEEIQRILETLVDKLTSDYVSIRVGEYHNLRDIDGNKVGEFIVSE